MGQLHGAQLHRSSRQGSGEPAGLSCTLDAVAAHLLRVARLQEAQVPFLRRSTRPDGFRDGMKPGGLQSGCQCQSAGWVFR